jgi:hypothetical protein
VTSSRYRSRRAPSARLVGAGEDVGSNNVGAIAEARGRTRRRWRRSWGICCLRCVLLRRHRNCRGRRGRGLLATPMMMNSTRTPRTTHGHFRDFRVAADSSTADRWGKLVSRRLGNGRRGGHQGSNSPSLAYRRRATSRYGVITSSALASPTPSIGCAVWPRSRCPIVGNQ